MNKKEQNYTRILVDGIHFLNSSYGLAETSFAEMDLKHAAFYCMLLRLRLAMTYWNSVDVVIGWTDMQSSVRKQLVPAYWGDEYHTDERWMTCKEWVGDYMVDLARMGFTSQLSFTGLEGIDLLAHIAKRNKDKDHVILSRDNRALQCLSDNTRVQVDLRTEKNAIPTVITRKDFITQFEIVPEKWPEVLAIAGSHKDNLRGARGVGYVGALRYVAGTNESPKTKTLIEASWAEVQVQTKINTLPIAEFELASPPVNQYDPHEAIQVMKERKLEFEMIHNFWTNLGEGHV